MKVYYCWKCDRKMPFLNEEEWALIKPTMKHGKRPIVEYREAHNCDLKTAREMVRTKPMDIFYSITGIDRLHWDVISHHRLSDWGDECTNCGYLLRTRTAKMCANCGRVVKAK